MVATEKGVDRLIAKEDDSLQRSVDYEGKEINISRAAYADDTWHLTVSIVGGELHLKTKIGKLHSRRR